METEEGVQNVNVHHGHSTGRTRIEKDIKQGALAVLVSMTQPSISKYGEMRVIKDEVLNRFARTPNAPVECLKALEEDASPAVLKNTINSVHDNKDSSMGSTGYNNDSVANTLNPTDRIIELYERFPKERGEKYAALKKRIQSLEQQNNSGK